MVRLVVGIWRCRFCLFLLAGGIAEMMMMI